VHVTAEHPITAGLNSFDTIDELYCNQQGALPITLLAAARSTVTGKDEPMAFVYAYGRGRVFQTVLGHAAESIRVPGTATLVLRGAAWAAGRRPKPPAGTSP
jgi:type 1 glutamine amidotransferase